MAIDLEVRLDGSASPQLVAAWQSLTVRDRGGVEEDSATLVLAAPDPAGIPVPRGRVRIDFLVGSGRLGSTFVATAVAGDTRRGTLTIEAAGTDSNEALRTTRDASWSGRTVGQIATDVAGRAGLRAVVAPSLRDRRPATALQMGESDQQFLRRAAAQIGGRLVVRGGDLVVLADQQGLTVTEGAEGTVTIDLAAEGAWVTWRRTLRHPPATVVARYDAPDTGPPASAAAGSGKPLQVLGDVYPGKAAAEAAAAAALRRARRGVDEIVITTGLRPDINALRPLRLTGLPPGLGADGLLAHAVTHALTARGAASTTITARVK